MAEENDEIHIISDSDESLLDSTQESAFSETGRGTESVSDEVVVVGEFDDTSTISDTVGEGEIDNNDSSDDTDEDEIAEQPDAESEFVEGSSDSEVLSVYDFDIY